LAAEDAALVKPSASAFRVHWPQNAGVSAPRQSMNVRCPEHPLNVHPCPQCAAKKCPPDEDYLAEKKKLEARKTAAHPSAKPVVLTDAESVRLLTRAEFSLMPDTVKDARQAHWRGIIRGLEIEHQRRFHSHAGDLDAAIRESRGVA
jgi:hypothetical protein